MYGYIGKILKVDLTKGTAENIHPSQEIYRKYLYYDFDFLNDPLESTK